MIALGEVISAQQPKAGTMTIASISSSLIPTSQPNTTATQGQSTQATGQHRHHHHGAKPTGGAESGQTGAATGQSSTSTASTNNVDLTA